MDAIPTTGLPDKWLPYITAAVVLAQVLGRVYHSLVNGGGLLGVWRGFLYGTNTPPKV